MRWSDVGEVKVEATRCPAAPIGGGGAKSRCSTPQPRPPISTSPYGSRELTCACYTRQAAANDASDEDKRSRQPDAPVPVDQLRLLPPSDSASGPELLLDGGQGSRELVWQPVSGRECCSLTSAPAGEPDAENCRPAGVRQCKTPPQRRPPNDGRKVKGGLLAATIRGGSLQLLFVSRSCLSSLRS
ncbi:hypothetical protein ABW21_db0207612 [Orbilia brochopaga]|nr:hypothetical protein ABW21_db0207612 [Drechslerella brochopaga]